MRASSEFGVAQRRYVLRLGRIAPCDTFVRRLIDALALFGGKEAALVFLCCARLRIVGASACIDRVGALFRKAEHGVG